MKMTQNSLASIILNATPSAFVGQLPIVGIDAAVPSVTSDMEKKAEAAYKTIADTIKTEQAVAKKEGKTLLVIMGEDHLDRGSMLAELLVLKAAHQHGIKDMALEIDRPLLEVVRANYQDKQFHLLHVPEIIADAERKDIKVIPADQPTLPTHEREDFMIKTATTLKNDAVFLMGNNHVMAVLAEEPELAKTKHVVLLNVGNTSAQDIEDYKMVKPFQAKLSKMLNNPRLGTQIELGEAFEDLPKSKVLELAAKVTQQPELPELLLAHEPHDEAVRLRTVRLVDILGQLPPLQPPVVNTPEVAIKQPPVFALPMDDIMKKADDYSKKMYAIVKDAGLEDKVQQLLADQELIALEKKSQANLDKHSAAYKKLDTIDMPRGYDALSQEDKKRYDVLFAEANEVSKLSEKENAEYERVLQEKTVALGVNDPEKIRAVNAVYHMKLQERQREVNLQPAVQQTSQDKSTVASAKDPLQENALHIADKLRGLYAQGTHLEQPVYIKYNKAVIDIRSKDYKAAGKHMKESIAEFDGAFHKPEGAAKEVKLRMVALLGQLQAINKEHVQSRNALPATPMRQKPREH